MARKSKNSAAPYLRRALEDPEVREGLLAAFQAGRKVYKRFDSKGLKAVEDKKLSKDLFKSTESMQDVYRHLQGGSSHRWFWFGLLVGAGAAIHFADELKGFIKDLTDSDS